MAAAFEIGDPQRPKGHALLYFRVAGGGVVATYVVVLPIAINPAKYIPPAFAARMPQQMNEVAATALPPIPEAVESEEAMRRLAVLRGDDLLDGGVVEDEPERLMLAAHQSAETYAEQYHRHVAAEPLPAQEPEPAPDEETLRWMLMNDKERIGELAKLTGQLRYAMDGSDEQMRDGTLAQMEKLKAMLPEKYRVDEFLAAVQQAGDRGRRLAELYIDRCYKLSNEEYEALSELDREIDALGRP